MGKERIESEDFQNDGWDHVIIQRGVLKCTEGYTAVLKILKLGTQYMKLHMNVHTQSLKF